MGIPAFTDSVVREIHNGASISFSILMHTVDQITLFQLFFFIITLQLFKSIPNFSFHLFLEKSY